MTPEETRIENNRLRHELIRLRARLEACEFDRRTWKSGFWLMNLIVACYIAFCLVSDNSLHG